MTHASCHIISFMLRISPLDPYHVLHMTDLYLSGRTQLNPQPYQRPSQDQLNGFLNIFLRRSHSMETRSVKSIPKDFSEVEPVNGEKIS